MDGVNPRWAGLAVHKRTVVACGLVPGPSGETVRHLRTVATITADLLARGDGLAGLEITDVAMESTGECWKPGATLSEDRVTPLGGNAQHIKPVPGRKTEVRDAEWVAALLRHGLLRGRVIPPLPQREVRDLTRQRTTLVRERGAVVQRLQKVLAGATLQLAAVATDGLGQSARAMRAVIVAGQTDPLARAALAQGRLRQKRAALALARAGRGRTQQRVLMAGHRPPSAVLAAPRSPFDARIQAQRRPAPDAPLASGAAPVADGRGTTGGGAAAGAPPAPVGPVPWEDAVALLTTIPGVGRRTAAVLVAASGTARARFASPRPLAGWAKGAPGTDESAGTRRPAGSGAGTRWRRGALVQAAHAAVKVKGACLRAVYQRWAGRRGARRAIIARAPKRGPIISRLLPKRAPYRARGAADRDERRRAQLVHRRQHRLGRLG